MKGNETLAGYDMVLALSENTINYQFQELHKRNIIHKKWGLLSGKIKIGKEKHDFHITETNADFTQRLKRWIEIQKQIAEAKDAGEWAEIGQLVNTLENENSNFNFGWDANLEAPTIRIIQNDQKNLILQIQFKSGKLYHRSEETSTVKSYDLKGLVYAFKVPIGQLKVNKEQMILDAGSEAKKIIRNSGLTDQDFTIESLFLNFQDANISTFDKNKSTFPEEASLAFQVAVENYFNVIVKKEEQSYVLGYSIQRKKIKATEKAMFQPTALGFSTSYSNHQKKSGQFSAFNFLMMLNDTKPPTNTSAGILPQSLIELGKDTTSTTDGVFAIQKAHFNTYLDSLDAYVQTTFTDLDGTTLRHGFTNGIMVLDKHEKHKDDTIDTVFTITKQSVKNNNGNSGISVRYKIEISTTVIVKAWFVKVGEQVLSTSGQYTKGTVDKKGTAGYLDFNISAGKSGRFDLDHSLSTPSIAFNENPNLFEGGFWKVFLNILILIFAWYVKVIDGIVNQIAVDLGKASVADNTKLISKLNDIDVLNQTNKIILPLGKVYAFKNLRIEDPQDIVAYDISYAPVIEK